MSWCFVFYFYIPLIRYNGCQSLKVHLTVIHKAGFLSFDNAALRYCHLLFNCQKRGKSFPSQIFIATLCYLTHVFPLSCTKKHANLCLPDTNRPHPCLCHLTPMNFIYINHKYVYIACKIIEKTVLS